MQSCIHVVQLWPSEKKQLSRADKTETEGKNARHSWSTAYIYMMSKYGAHGIINPIYARIQEDEICSEFCFEKKRKKKWTGWRPKTDEQKNDFKKKVMQNGEEKIDEN